MLSNKLASLPAPFSLLEEANLSDPEHSTRLVSYGRCLALINQNSSQFYIRKKLRADLVGCE